LLLIVVVERKTKEKQKEKRTLQNGSGKYISPNTGAVNIKIPRLSTVT